MNLFNSFFMILVNKYKCGEITKEDKFIQGITDYEIMELKTSWSLFRTVYVFTYKENPNTDWMEIKEVNIEFINKDHDYIIETIKDIIADKRKLHYWAADDSEEYIYRL